MSNQLICFIARDWCVIGHRRGVESGWEIDGGCADAQICTLIFWLLLMRGSMAVLFCHWMLMNLRLPSLCLSFLFSALSRLPSFFNLCYIHTRLILLVCWNRLIFYISLNIQNKFSIFDTFIHIQILLQGSEYFDWAYTAKNIFECSFFVLIILFRGTSWITIDLIVDLNLIAL